MFSLSPTPRPQPTMLPCMAVPVCGSAAERSIRDGEVVSSILTTPTRTAITGSEPKATFGTVDGIDNRAKREANADD